MKADLLHVTSAFVLVSASQPTAALQPSIYGFTAVYGFIAATCNLQIKSNHLFRQADTKKNVDKMSNEKA